MDTMMSLCFCGGQVGEPVDMRVSYHGKQQKQGRVHCFRINNIHPEVFCSFPSSICSLQTGMCTHIQEVGVNMSSSVHIKGLSLWPLASFSLTYIYLQLRSRPTIQRSQELAFCPRSEASSPEPHSPCAITICLSLIILPPIVIF